jgi:capsular polysaccharide transport system permease protein
MLWSGPSDILNMPALAVGDSRPTAPLLQILRALWTVSLRTDVNVDRLGAFWWVTEPLAHVVLITITILFVHGADVYDMPSFPFAVLGVVVWLTFRTAFIAALSGPAALTLLMDHPSVTRFAIVLIRSLKGLSVNAVVATILLVVSIYFGWTTLPQDLLKVQASLVGAFLFGLSLGLTAQLGAQHYSGLRKVYPMLLRLLAVISGLFFVSEQVPGFISNFVLWNPLLHLSQFARSGWFFTYESQDTSLGYVLACLGPAACLGLACAIADRRERARRGEYA